MLLNKPLPNISYISWPSVRYILSSQVPLVTELTGFNLYISNTLLQADLDYNTLLLGMHSCLLAQFTYNSVLITMATELYNVFHGMFPSIPNSYSYGADVLYCTLCFKTIKQSPYCLQSSPAGKMITSVCINLIWIYPLCSQVAATVPCENLIYGVLTDLVTTQVVGVGVLKLNPPPRVVRSKPPCCTISHMQARLVT